MKGRESARLIESREGEMRRECALLAGNAERRECCVDRGGKLGELRAGGDAGPQNARVAIVGKESEAAKIDGERSARSFRKPFRR